MTYINLIVEAVTDFSPKEWVYWEKIENVWYVIGSKTKFKKKYRNQMDSIRASIAWNDSHGFDKKAKEDKIFLRDLKNWKFTMSKASDTETTSDDE